MPFVANNHLGLDANAHEVTRSAIHGNTDPDIACDGDSIGKPYIQLRQLRKTGEATDELDL